jgi:REP element-mobilizing transposase RayT
MNRGIAKRPLFESLDDARFFLSRVVRQVRLGRIEVHSYSLLTTHFHMLVRSPLGEMSEAMRRLQNEYVRRFNRLRKRDGGLLRGRFRSKRVRSSEYRRALVRYIDANPVSAGIVSDCEHHALGSAASYLGGRRTPWLERSWVEEAARRLSGCETFSPQAYRAAFGPRDGARPEELAELVETRCRQFSATDDLESLVGSTPTRVRRWMEYKALLADGHDVGLAVCGPLALSRALEENLRTQGPWPVRNGGELLDGERAAWHGLHRDLCRSTWQEMARWGEGSPWRARRLAGLHRRLVAESPEYAERASHVARSAIDRCFDS